LKSDFGLFSFDLIKDAADLKVEVVAMEASSAPAAVDSDFTCFGRGSGLMPNLTSPGNIMCCVVVLDIFFGLAGEKRVGGSSFGNSGQMSVYISLIISCELGGGWDA